MKRTLLVTGLMTVFALTAWVPAPSPGQTEPYITFMGVSLDPETRQADEKIRDALRAGLNLKFEKQSLDYGAAIQALVQWDPERQGPFMARVTPYVFVVAELLGAEMEILATYQSRKTRETTYHAYMVTRRDRYPAEDLDTLVKLLRERQTPARFIYHNKFSTSSYFLPSLYFRQRRIFSLREGAAPNPKYTTIRAVRPEGVGGSSDLVRRVLAGQADFAAVWDGTKSKFDRNPELRFLKLPQALPNDLLVMSHSSRPDLRADIRRAVDGLRIDIGDFLEWRDFNKTPDARRALAALRWLAKVPPNPVPIQIRKPHGDDSIHPRYLEAAREAVRLSGTEFVLYDEDFHQQYDVLWTLSQTHEDSLVIQSEMVGSGLEPQVFHVSFRRDDLESLVQRIGQEIKNHMHRIRYIWPFDTSIPRVLRDVEFNLPAGTRMKAIKVQWNDLTSNEFIRDRPFDVQVLSSDFHSFQLAGDGFPRRAEQEFDFDPMSNTMYRVYLVRPEPTGRLYQVMTGLFIGLYLAGAVLALRAVFHKPAPPSVS